MVNSTLVAYFVDIFASIMAQVGLILQKLAHRHQEKKGKAYESPSKYPETGQTYDMKTTETEPDEGTGNTYCSWRFLLGFAFMVLGSVIHVGVLPFIDLTLIACNSCVGIIASVILSTAVLGERFIPQYDLVAMVFIAMGCTTLVLNANKNE